MGGCRIADFVDTLHNGIESRVITDSCVGTVEVIVNGTRQTDNGHIEFLGKNAGASERAVAANHHERVDFVAAHVVISELSSLGSLEFGATCRFQDSASHLNDIRYILGFEFHDFIGNKTAISTVYSFNFKSAENSRAGDGADGCIHAGGIASGSKNAYTFYVCHTCFQIQK